MFMNGRPDIWGVEWLDSVPERIGKSFTLHLGI